MESHNQKVPSVLQHYLTFLTICFGRSSCLFQYVVQVLHFLYRSAEIASLFSWMLARPVILFWHVSYIPEHSKNPRTKSLEQISVRNLICELARLWIFLDRIVPYTNRISPCLIEFGPWGEDAMVGFFGHFPAVIANCELAKSWVFLKIHWVLQTVLWVYQDILYDFLRFLKRFYSIYLKTLNYLKKGSFCC